MNQYVNAVRAAVKAAAPVVAIPVEGRAPVCIKAKLLKGALKGVEVLTVQILDNGWLKVTGRAGNVRTSSKFAPMARYEALRMVGEWAIKEKEKALKIINQGVLSTQSQREMKLKAKEREAAQEWDRELKGAIRVEQSILKAAREHVNPAMDGVPKCKQERDTYIAFHKTRHLRKRASVILREINRLRTEAEALTVTEKEKRTRLGRGRYSVTPAVTRLRRGKSAEDLLAITTRIGALNSQFKSLFPPRWTLSEYADHGGYWVDSFIPKRPTAQAVELAYSWHTNKYNREDEAHQLRQARATIKAMTPPAEAEELAEAA